ncbi:Cystathionine beta-lyase, type II (EC [Olavius algarvensis associated proteobacterium Delta 3]|nr:Cystathionine beta-lyase, type II (EC [Olavius algarvensis associated proteobacterium Delta 3]CAB5156145.1 Cystathionine beta-lyase, type II (EC [Olavius algarvensis associated proteobacterium Delta 3]
MKTDFDAQIQRRGTDSVKWDRYTSKDIIPLWLADMDFQSPSAVREALHDRIEHGIFGYTGISGALTQVVVDTLERKYGWSVAPSWLIWLPGIVTGLNIACRAVGKDGDAVMTTTPVYPPFLTAPKLSRRKLIPVPLLLENNRWSMDWDRLDTQITERCRLFMLCNPHNPVGRVYHHNELTRLVDFCIRHDMVICSDEIHSDLILEPDRHHIPTASLNPEASDCTITLMAPSKTFNIPGLGCGFAVIPNSALRTRFKKAMDGIVPHVNALGLTAALAAYRAGWDWLSELLVYLRANRNLVQRHIAALPGLRTWPVEATYLAWIDARNIGRTSPLKFFESFGVGLSDGEDFGNSGFLRLNFGCSRSLLAQALERMASAIRTL